MKFIIAIITGILAGTTLGVAFTPQFAKVPQETVYKTKWVDRSVLALDENNFQHNLSKEAQNGWYINYADDGKIQFIKRDDRFLYRKEIWHDRVATERLDEYGTFGWELVAVLDATDSKGRQQIGRKVYYFKMPRQSREQ